MASIISSACILSPSGTCKAMRVVAVFDARHQLLELEIMTVEVHGAPGGRQAVRFQAMLVAGRVTTRPSTTSTAMRADRLRDGSSRCKSSHSGAFLDNDDHLCDFRAAATDAVDDGAQVPPVERTSSTMSTRSPGRTSLRYIAPLE